MASKFMFFRPRGVSGNYKVGIIFELQPTERVEVWRADEQDKKEMLKRSEQVIHRDGTILAEAYIFSRFHVGEMGVWIIIRDSDVAYEQRIRYKPTPTTIEKEYVNKGIEFHTIELIDLDKLGFSVVSDISGMSTFKQYLLEPGN